jgi:hypothetical protein
MGDMMDMAEREMEREAAEEFRASRKLEKQHVERPVCRWADLVGLKHVKLNLQGRRGYPDRLFFVPGGKPLFIEFKRPTGKLSALQEKTIKELRGLGYAVKVFDSAERAINYLTRQIMGAPPLSKAGCELLARASPEWAVPGPRHGKDKYRSRRVDGCERPNADHRTAAPMPHGVAGRDRKVVAIRTPKLHGTSRQGQRRAGKREA